MNSTHLFSIEWDNSYNDPDYAIPGTFNTWLDNAGSLNQERLAKMLEFLAKAMRERKPPFHVRNRKEEFGDKP